MVESKLVELVVAGSNPVGHPIFLFIGLQKPCPELPQKVTTYAAIFDGVIDI